MMHLLTDVYIVAVLITVPGESANCSEGCLEGACDSDGVCTTGCKPNYVGATCDSCSPTGAYWNAEFQQCHSCTQVCLTCVSLTNCTECVTDGIYGDTCESSCGFGCKNKSCDKNTGACECNTGYAPDKCATCADGYYQDGYDCLECTGDCLTCSLDGNDVVCESCSTGVYGESCDIPCPVGCAASKCFMNGTCSDGCNGGFMGVSCGQCVEGKYGDTCPTLCPAGCEGDCDKASGTCTACKDGYSGDLCCLQNTNCETCSSSTKCSECKGGFYGATCEGVCPQNCRSCSSTDDCASFCVDGFYGVACDQNCPENCKACESASACSTCEAGYFGATCQEECAENCVENTCQKVSGNCLACEEGFKGNKCDEVSAGYPVAEVCVWMLMLPLVIAILMT